MKDFIDNWNTFVEGIKTVSQSGGIVIQERQAISGETGQGTKTFALPKFRISEKWGTPGDESRQEIEMFLNKIPAGNLQQKIQFVNKFINDCKEKCVEKNSTSTILANLVFLETLATIIYDFNYSTGGFLFEVFLAALLGTDAQQIVATQSRKKGEAGDIADITGPSGEPISLKFFKESGSQYISGSLRDLKASILKYGRSITYLVVIKSPGQEGGDVSKINFYQFELGAYVDLDPDSEYLKLVQGDFIADQFEKGPQFKIPVKRVINKLKKPYAELNFGSRKALHDVAATYVDVLGSDIENIYNALDRLTKNINKYLVNDDTSAGTAAVKNAEDLRDATINVAPSGKEV